MNVSVPFTAEQAKQLKAGDVVTISGVIYTARDAAHKRMLEEFDKTGKAISIEEKPIKQENFHLMCKIRLYIMQDQHRQNQDKR